MAVFMSLGGNSSGDGFLLAPLSATYDAEVVLWTDAGTASVTLQASPNPAGLVFSQVAVSISTAPTSVLVHATAQSSSRGDTTIQVLEGAVVVASSSLTAIKHPVVNFRGRFEARFATDGSQYNRNPFYTAVLDAVVPPGWTWGLEGEPDFVPTVNNVPTNLEMAVGRVVRFNNPISLRSHAAPVVSTVSSVTGETTAGTETFVAGDPLIGQPVDVGADTYLAGNAPHPPSGPQPEESWDAALEPMALFELHFGSMFGGASKIGPFVGAAATPNVHTRSPDSRPIANGLVGAAADLTEFGLPTLATFSEARIDALVADFNALPADTPQRRNLVRRIGHLLQSVSAVKRTAVQAANPGAFTLRAGTLPQGWSSKEVYLGKVDANLAFAPSGSSVVAYLSEFGSFNFKWQPFAFHSDELCGHHKGTLTPDLSFHGSYTGDPHTHTVDGTNYDFQAVGEFTLLRDGAGMEVQVRQTPVRTANPVADAHTGLTVCVSVITAVGARVGSHTVALQPMREGHELAFYLDGKRTDLVTQGIDLGLQRVTTFDADGDTGLRIDYLDGTVLTATPAFWSSYDVWYINVNISNTRADEGIMGFVPADSWLPRLRDGASVGPMPASPGQRYATLYRKFADSWRVTDVTSLFVYEPGTSTKDFTDPEWPSRKPPCELKPEFERPGANVLPSKDIDEARQICSAVTMKDLHANCVFDVATTGDEALVKGYLMAQELRLYGTSVQIEGHEAPVHPSRAPVSAGAEGLKSAVGSLVVTANVSALTLGRPTPTGSVTFYVDGVPARRPTRLDSGGRARATLAKLAPGKHTIRATYSGGGRFEYHRSSSGNLVHTVAGERAADPPGRSVMGRRS